MTFAGLSGSGSEIAASGGGWTEAHAAGLNAWIESISFFGRQEQICRDMPSSLSNFRFSEMSDHIAVTAAIGFDTLALGRDHQ